VVLARPPQTRVEALPARARKRLVGAAARVVVDRSPVRDRLGVLLRRPPSRLRAARRLRCGRDGLLRGLDLLHVGRNAPVAGDDQRGSRSRSPPGEAARAHVRAAPHRLVEQRRSATRNRLLQLLDLPRARGRARRRHLRPPGLEAGRIRLGLLPRLRYLAYAEVCGHALWTRNRTLEWKIAAVNLVGCIAFGISAIASFWVPSSGDVLALAASNWFTALGGLCFLVGAILLLPESATTETMESGGAALYAHS
jgi:hypothetical protein